MAGWRPITDAHRNALKKLLFPLEISEEETRDNLYLHVVGRRPLLIFEQRSFEEHVEKLVKVIRYFGSLQKQGFDVRRWYRAEPFRDDHFPAYHRNYAERMYSLLPVNVYNPHPGSYYPFLLGKAIVTFIQTAIECGNLNELMTSHFVFPDLDMYPQRGWSGTQFMHYIIDYPVGADALPFILSVRREATKGDINWCSANTLVVFMLRKAHTIRSKAAALRKKGESVNTSAWEAYFQMLLKGACDGQLGDTPLDIQTFFSKMKLENEIGDWSYVQDLISAILYTLVRNGQHFDAVPAEYMQHLPTSRWPDEIRAQKTQLLVYRFERLSGGRHATMHPFLDITPEFRKQLQEDDRVFPPTNITSPWQMHTSISAQIDPICQIFTTRFDPKQGRLVNEHAMAIDAWVITDLVYNTLPKRKNRSTGKWEVLDLSPMKGNRTVFQRVLHSQIRNFREQIFQESQEQLEEWKASCEALATARDEPAAAYSLAVYDDDEYATPDSLPLQSAALALPVRPAEIIPPLQQYAQDSEDEDEALAEASRRSLRGW